MEPYASLYIVVPNTIEKLPTKRVQRLLSSLDSPAGSINVYPNPQKGVVEVFFATNTWRQTTQLAIHARRLLEGKGFEFAPTLPATNIRRASTFLTLEQVGQLCGVHKRTVWRWYSKKQLACVEISNRLVVPKSEFNRLLADCARGFDNPPCLEDLESGQLTLVDASQAKEKFGFGEKYLWDLASRGGLPFIKFPGKQGHVCFSESALAQIKGIDPYTVYSVALHIMGGSRNTLDLLIAAKKLEPAFPPFDKRSKYVSFHSFVELLEEFLPSWITSEEWLEKRLATTKKLLIAKEVDALVGGWRQRLKLIEAKQLPHIGCLGGRINYFDPDGVARVVAQRRKQ